MYYGLVLSMMRSAHWESSDQLVAWSETREALERFVESEKVEPWVDDNPAMANFNGTRIYRKTFRKGGPLEWYNPTSATLNEYIVPIPKEVADDELASILKV